MSMRTTLSKDGERATSDPARFFDQKLKHLGVHSGDVLNAVVGELKILPAVTRGAHPLRSLEVARKLLVLLDGIACLNRTLKDGGRQLTCFYFGGDVLTVNGFGSFEKRGLELGALTTCVFGTIDLDFLNEQLQRHPSLSLAFWRAAMVEISVCREWLLNVTRKSAVQRVAHLICEILSRQEASGISGTSIPLTQLDIADAAGLSPVHVNRTFQILRARGVLSDTARMVEVTDRGKLEEIGGFDSHYLKMAVIMSEWDAK